MSLKNLMETTSKAMELKPDTLAPASSYVTNGAVFTWGAMTFNEIMMLIATLLAVATFLVNLHFQRRRDKREQELHGHKMAEREAEAARPDQLDS